MVYPKENPSSVLDLGLMKPNGYYDYLEITVELVSSNAISNLVNKSLSNSCKIGSSQTFQIFSNQTNMVTVNNLCMLSSYSVSTKTVLAGYDTVEYSSLFATGLFYLYRIL